MPDVALHDLVAMFFLGLLGSAHCLGMCAPIAFAIGPAVGGPRRALVALLYNLGRVTTYVALGAFVAALGGSVGLLGGIARVQIVLAIVAGILLAWFGLGLLGVVRKPLSEAGGVRIPGASTLLLRVAKHGGPTAFPLGVLLGFLPCGLSMAALTRALSAGSATAGALLVAAFGAGTFPAMFAAGWVGGLLSVGRRRVAELIAGLLLVGMAAQHLARAVAHLSP